jgi:hypothetical protein
MLGLQNTERILKVGRGKYQVDYKSKSIRITDFSAETLTARRA